MNDQRAGLRLCDLDSLRLIALGRIPRCRRCPRYAGLVDAHAESRSSRALAAPPAHCTYQVCAPLAARYGPAAGGAKASVTHRAATSALARLQTR